MCQTTCRKPRVVSMAATETDSEFDSSLDCAMNSHNLPFQLKEKQVGTLMVLHSGQDAIAVFSTAYEKQGTERE